MRALKSGKYGKGNDKLARSPDTGYGTYCCLGVLAAEMVPEFCHVDYLDRCMTVGDVEDNQKSWLPDDLATLWGLDIATQKQLALINDRSNTFAPVIEYIETNL